MDILEPRRDSKRLRLTGLALGLVLASGFVGWLYLQKQSQLASESRPPRVVHPFRLPIKLTLDHGARNIETESRRSTIADLLNMPRDHDGEHRRVAPLETTEWQLEVWIKEIQKSPDGDIVMTLFDGKNAISAEIPDPSVCAKSPYVDRIASLRDEVIARWEPTRTSKELNRRVRITGIGFAGMPNSRTRSGVRLYPALSIELL